MPAPRDIKGLRPAKAPVDPWIPYAYLHEQEPDDHGVLQEVNTVFLTGKECAFTCVMCDLWKHTLDGPTPSGSLVRQIAYALERLPDAHVIKLYNGSNFFDPGAVPPQDYQDLARELKGYRRIIVENHPSLCGTRCLDFQDLLDGTLEVAMGLETIHPEALSQMNKHLNTAQFTDAVDFLRSHGMDTRAFVLLNPPYLLGSASNRYWTMETLRFAFAAGVQTCSIIPVRSGNGLMEWLASIGCWEAPQLQDLEAVFDEALQLGAGRVFADTWELPGSGTCESCYSLRLKRLHEMNLSQRLLPPINCSCQVRTDEA